jgi:8-oxo-dGTP pyrophosphatase MutT (NUDIX family)
VGKDTQKTTILREFSSGGVVFKKDKGTVLYLVCKSNPSKDYPGDYWRLPKGWMDDLEGGKHPGPISSGEVKAKEEDLVKGAIREVREEGGVDAKIIKKIDTAKYFMTSSRGRVMKFATYFLMEWVRDLPEGFDFETEKTEWLNYSDAFKRLNSSWEKQILEKANKLLIES